MISRPPASSSTHPDTSPSSDVSTADNPTPSLADGTDDGQRGSSVVFHRNSGTEEHDPLRTAATRSSNQTSTTGSIAAGMNPDGEERRDGPQREISPRTVNNGSQTHRDHGNQNASAEAAQKNVDKPQSGRTRSASSPSPDTRGNIAEELAGYTLAKGPAGRAKRTTVPSEISTAATPATTAAVPLTVHVHSRSPHQQKGPALKLSPAQIKELTSAPDSLCFHTIPTELDYGTANPAPAEEVPARDFWLADDDGQDRRQHQDSAATMGLAMNTPNTGQSGGGGGRRESDTGRRKKSGSLKHANFDQLPDFSQSLKQPHSASRQRSQTAKTASSSRRLRSPFETDRQPGNWKSRTDRCAPGHPNTEDALRPGPLSRDAPSPVPASIPLPPFSIPTYLQLELSSDRPSPLYIHQSRTKDFPYESSRAKIERLQNFLLLPPSLESVLLFGALACLDSWLYSFTILPLRFCKSIIILSKSWLVNFGLEVRDISAFIAGGLGRVWSRRRRARSVGRKPKSRKSSETTCREREVSSNILTTVDEDSGPNQDLKRGDDIQRRISRHRRTKSVPSGLLPDDKADILKGLLMVFTCTILLYFDASRMYHWIRGQAAIKLYVIYNVLEVGDRLFSAIGQDVLECLFSREALERKPDGRSKVLRPFWLFLLALVYTIIHSTALFYQVMTLNVAVNSYSNALITLLLSNQFVEIKSTVFKKFEKENLFQLTCADVVERFQLWLMLLIIASRNFVETGALSFGNAIAPFSRSATNTTTSTPASNPPRSASSILPQSFTLLPSSLFAYMSNMNTFLPTIGHVLGPFLVVLGSEMLVDWLKHAYVNKFNNIRPSVYGKFLDILAKDYYTNAFADQNLNRRLGLPVIPLSCLFIRVSIQTYQMFLTAWLPQPPSLTTPLHSTSLSAIHEHYSSTSAANASLTFSFPMSLSQANLLMKKLISHTTPSPTAYVPIFTVILLLLLYVTLLLVKLILGMILLGYSRARYKQMKLRERELFHQQQKQAQSKPTPAFQPTENSLPSPPPEIAPPSFSLSGNGKGRAASDTVEGSRRFGGWGAVEVGQERRNWIYTDDPAGLQRLKERDERDAAKATKTGGGMHGFENVRRYEMVGKRIW
ncbi:hypothetical protein LOZ61_005604 [Ophidiomyces ophidiicola]|nr:hypothetical protein LOZ61_005604 [Ophidiomyces ophidiicola]KAI1931043.1 hypothetical protein LOZ60_000477 [Ophidiomyces ophidiicola]KAI1968295.1 hypothetical protein LOZ56_005111 [Ophidiomyces ophidiicola]KAI2148897.1 hypothetical protein LOZ27_001424 [Ophidiomyces ophidiicola]KAI2240106.1 hypothetical protein LOZ13_003164 [Ophidiomyces ophidiicola]